MHRQPVPAGELPLADDRGEGRIDCNQLDALAGTTPTDHLGERSIGEGGQHRVTAGTPVLPFLVGEVEALDGNRDALFPGIQHDAADGVADCGFGLVLSPAREGPRDIPVIDWVAAGVDAGDGQTPRVQVHADAALVPDRSSQVLWRPRTWPAHTTGPPGG